MNYKTANRLTSAALVLTLASASFIGGTYAKYTSTSTGSSTATVAKWSYLVNDLDIAQAGNETFTFDLFGTVNEIATTTAETDVKSGKIAPGTTGQFDMTMYNASDVSSKYTITLEETNEEDIPIQYSLDGTNWSDSIDSLDKTSITDVSVNAGKPSSKVLYWRWMYEGTDTGAPADQSDEDDTALGTETTLPTVTVQASITATQVN